MNTHVLLYQLRERLRWVNECITQRKQQRERGDLYMHHADGALTELHSEATFLSGLIADLEREGVTP